MTDRSSPVTVLFVAGSGRSGSTLLGSLLGQVPGLEHVGELRQVWRRGLVEDWLCGCGARFSACPTWQSVLPTAFDAPADASAALAAERAVLRVRHVPRVLASRWQPRLLRSQVQAYEPFLAPLYRALAGRDGVGIVVDTSKTPSYGWVLAHLPGVDVRVVHLVRDPRGTAYSWSKQRARHDAGGSRDMDRFGPLKSTALWALWNGVTELLWAGHPERSLRLRYEDLVADPEGSLRRVCALAGVDEPDLSFLDGRVAHLGTSHTISGNPGRMDRGRLALRDDDAWRTGLPAGHRRLVSALAGAQLRRYGYRRAAAPASRPIVGETG